jgi:excisionase family DNA binding protein
MNNSLLTVRDLSSMLQLHPNSIYKLVRAREIPFIKRKSVGIRFRGEEIEEWLALL